jgi:hypothetical protein
MGMHRNYDSSGPDVKIRGTANHIFDRYCQLARDANASGDRIGAENYLQHAEHYYRIMLANGLLQPRHNGQPQPQAQPGNGQQPVQPAPAEFEGGEVDADPNAEEAAI